MLTKTQAIHIIDAANSILLRKEDMVYMHVVLTEASDVKVIKGYMKYIQEIIRQCNI